MSSTLYSRREPLRTETSFVIDRLNSFEFQPFLSFTVDVDMTSEAEVLSRFAHLPLLEATINTVAARLEQAYRLAAAAHRFELIQFVTANERARTQPTDNESSNVSPDENCVGDDLEPADTVIPALLVEEADETAAEGLSPTLLLYDPAEAMRQLDSELPQSENSLESYLQVMSCHGSELRELILPEPGMAQACHALMDEFPNLTAAVELIAGAVSLAERHQLPIQLPRLLIDGPPGCGKTQLLRRVSKLLNLPLVVISMSALHGDFELAGCSRVYRGAEPGKLIKSLLTLKVGNPIYLFDEAELGHQKHYGPLLSFLEDQWFTDAFFEMLFRTEFINKVFITNTASLLTPAIRSRLYSIEVSQPSISEMRVILQRVYANLRTSKLLFSEFPEVLDPELIEVLLKEPLRSARNFLEAALYRAACRNPEVSNLHLSLLDLKPKTPRTILEFEPGHA